MENAPGAVVDVHLAHAGSLHHAVESHSLTWWIVDSFTYWQIALVFDFTDDPECGWPD